MDHQEDAEQAALFDWARTAKIKQLRWLHAIPNGGKRNIREAARLKRQGVKAGVADIFLPVPVPPYHGLYIEMKRARGRATTTAKQREFIADMELQGYRAVVCRGAGEAILSIKYYLKL
jgi:hypothetical protein